MTSFPDGAGKSPVSSGGGSRPVWASSGRELFYINGDKLMVVDVDDSRQPFAQANRRCSSEMRSAPSGLRGYAYDVSPDGQRFVTIQSADDVGAHQVNVVLGWSDELTRRARAARP